MQQKIQTLFICPFDLKENVVTKQTICNSVQIAQFSSCHLICVWYKQMDAAKVRDSNHFDFKFLSVFDTKRHLLFDF